jgi:hypothetical protein
VAGERSGAVIPTVAAAAVPAAPVIAVAAATPTNSGGLPPTANIVHGYDVDVLVDAAMGKCAMPTAPMYLDSFGMPLTRLAPTPLVTAAAQVPAPSPQQQQQQQQQPSALDIANAALAAAYGTAAPVQQQQQQQQQQSGGSSPTRVLVLSNMVTPEDLATDDDYQGLQEEVREECAKFGQLYGMQIPRYPGGSIQPSAIHKIYLEYASVQDAQAAERELAGRRFGDNVVQTSFFDETEYSSGRLS